MSKYYKYESGLTLLYEQNNINKSTGINISFDCGSRCDGKIPGLSHFCEHMLLSGTDKLSKQECLKRYFDFVRVNLYTTHKDICFTGNIITTKLANYLDCVQDVICNSTFKAQVIQEEKKVIEQEIATDADKHYRHADNFRLYETFEEECYKHSVLGSRESINSITSADVKRYIKKYFVNNNCIITVCSPLSFNKIKQIVKKNFEIKMPSNNLKPLPYKEQKVVEQQKVKLLKKDIDKAFLSIVFKCDNKGPDLQYYVALATMCNMIDDITNGLTKELRIDNSLVYGLWADNKISKNNSCISLNTEVFKENIKPCLDVTINYIKRIAIEGFTQQELDEELSRNEYYWQTRVPHPDHLLDSLIRYRWYGRFVPDKEIYEQTKNITLEQINKTAKDLFAQPNIKVLVYGNADKTDVYTLNQIQKKF